MILLVDAAAAQNEEQKGPSSRSLAPYCTITGNNKLPLHVWCDDAAATANRAARLISSLNCGPHEQIMPLTSDRARSEARR
jgi:hypothetical protein